LKGGGWGLGLGFEISVFRPRRLSFRFRVSVFGSQFSGFGFRDYRVGAVLEICIQDQEVMVPAAIGHHQLLERLRPRGHQYAHVLHSAFAG